ncbi:hypothetical protein ACFYTG_43810 [Streptomyces mirabilis]|uniref:hypothetical protein n=1 Tax=Streptomyces mirabilis TaxID=68239 RepID=UPI002E24F5A2
MKLHNLTWIGLLLTVMLAVTACGAQQEGDGAATPKQSTINEQQAIKRAKKFIQQAVDGMSPKPKLEQVGAAPVGACIARDDGGSDDRLQVSLAYVDRERSVMTIVSTERRDNFLGMLERHWKSKGYSSSPRIRTGWRPTSRPRTASSTPAAARTGGCGSCSTPRSAPSSPFRRTTCWCPT